MYHQESMFCSTLLSRDCHQQNRLQPGLYRSDFISTHDGQQKIYCLSQFLWVNVMNISLMHRSLFKRGFYFCTEFVPLITGLIRWQLFVHVLTSLCAMETFERCFSYALCVMFQPYSLNVSAVPFIVLEPLYCIDHLFWCTCGTVLLFVHLSLRVWCHKRGNTRHEWARSISVGSFAIVSSNVSLKHRCVGRSNITGPVTLLTTTHMLLCELWYDARRMFSSDILIIDDNSLPARSFTADLPLGHLFIRS